MQLLTIVSLVLASVAAAMPTNGTHDNQLGVLEAAPPSRPKFESRDNSRCEMTCHQSTKHGSRLYELRGKHCDVGEHGETLHKAAIYSQKFRDFSQYENEIDQWGFDEHDPFEGWEWKGWFWATIGRGEQVDWEINHAFGIKPQPSCQEED